jgi:putative phosphoesterase
LLVGAISDSHGNSKRILEALPYFEGVEHILHAGDFCEDAGLVREAVDCQVTAVAGNCDYMVRAPFEELLVLNGKRVYLTHGHLYNVKGDLSALAERARDLEVDVAVFGHTHTPQVFYQDDILFVNPGSLHRPRLGYQPSIALIDLSGQRPTARIVFL